jgi:hypothetical protein
MAVCANICGSGSVIGRGTTQRQLERHKSLQEIKKTS